MMFVCFLLVSRIAKEQIEPHVKSMEKEGDISQEIRDLMFNNGVNLTFFYVV